MATRKVITGRKTVTKMEVPRVSRTTSRNPFKPAGTAVVDAPTTEKVDKVVEKVEEVKEVILPVYDKKQVTRIMGTGHTRTHYHCEGLDGKTVVTFHAPRNLFA